MASPTDPLTKVCKKCPDRGAQPLGAFYRNARASDGHEGDCKQCKKMALMAWRAAHPDAHARIQQTYRKAHPERTAATQQRWLAANPYHHAERSKRRWRNPEQRAVLLMARRAHRHRKRANGGAGLTPAQIREVLAKPCAYCGRAATEIDHVMPLARGGRHELVNVAPACRSCNAKKWKRTPEEWKEAQRG